VGCSHHQGICPPWSLLRFSTEDDAVFVMRHSVAQVGYTRKLWGCSALLGQGCKCVIARSSMAQTRHSLCKSI